jgi:hypothetical protein
VEVGLNLGDPFVIICRLARELVLSAADDWDREIAYYPNLL